MEALLAKLSITLESLSANKRLKPDDEKPDDGAGAQKHLKPGPEKLMDLLFNKLIASTATVDVHALDLVPAWSRAKYLATQKMPLFEEPFNIENIDNLLKNVSPTIAEYILLLGVVSTARGVLRDRSDVTNTPVYTYARRLSMVNREASSEQDAIFTILCNSITHNMDRREELEAETKRRVRRDGVDRIEATIPQLRQSIANLIDTTLFPPPDMRHKPPKPLIDNALEKLYQGTFDRSPPIHRIDGFFVRLAISYGREITEDIVIAGCALLLRNILKCLRFGDGNDITNILKERLELMTAYERYRKHVAHLGPLICHNIAMLNDIIHARESTNTGFFAVRDSHYRERISTIRWEILDLMYAYVITPLSNPDFHGVRFLRAHYGPGAPELLSLMALGPAAFFNPE